MSTESDAALSSFAEYMTNSKRVVTASVGLEIGGSRGVDANEFFAMRNGFNVSGYMDATEALAAIKQVLADRG